MKHTALVAVLLHLRKKQAPFAVIDTHAGRGLYDLSGTEAGKTGEARQGIASLGDAPAGNEVLQTYLDTARSFGSGTYPGSPLIAARLLRPQDRLVAIEKHPEECEALTTALKPFHKTRAVCADGYERLAALLPPQERRGAILIDPPFEAPDEFAQMAGVLGNALRRFATGIYLLWFPIKTKSDADALSGEVLARGATKLLRLQLDVGASAEGRLTQTGLLIVNPPYGFDAQMREALSALAIPLGRARPATWSVDWLSGDG
jgi:23S rRNA (adenine2030-N6)-methyltransferase